MSDMLDRIGLVLFGFDSFPIKSWDEFPAARDQYRLDAGRLISAMREPTPEMLEAADKAMWGLVAEGPERLQTLKVGWQAMIDKAMEEKP